MEKPFKDVIKSESRKKLIIMAILLVITIANFIFSLSFDFSFKAVKASLGEELGSLIELWSAIIFFAFPIICIFLFDNYRHIKDLKSHIKYLQAVNPDIDFDYVSKKDIKNFLRQVVELYNYKYNGANHTNPLDRINYDTDVFKLEENYYYEHSTQLQSLDDGPKDFSTLSKDERARAIDDLDAIIYAKEITKKNK